MEGYFTFSKALELMKKGFTCARKGWNGKGMWVTATIPDFRMGCRRPIGGHPCLVMKPVEGRLTSWTPCDMDLFANDWYVVEEDACP